MIAISGNVKHLWPILLLVLLARPAPERVLVQTSISIQAEQSTSVVYGDSLTFEVQVTVPATLENAYLTVHVANRDDVYIEAVSLFPGTTVLASHTVTVDELQLPPFAQVVSFWNFQDENGNQYRSDEQMTLYEDTRVPWKWKRVSEGRITINTDGRDEVVAIAALRIASNALAQQSQALGLTSQNDISIYIYPELAQLAASLRLHQQRVQDWVAAYVIPDQHIILIAASPGAEMLPNMQRDLPHEITHLVINDIAGEAASNVPGWFSEGLALSSAPEIDPTFRDVLSEAVHEGVLLSLETLCVSSFSHLPPHDITLAYAQSESVVQYIAKRYGASQIQALMTAYADGLSCSGAVERALGISLTTLETQWHADLGSAISTTYQETSLAPWVLAWAISLILAFLFVSPQPQQVGEKSPFDTDVALSSLPDRSSGTGMDENRP